MIRISILATAVLLSACGSPSPVRSPTNDVQPPATTPGDGKVIGADQVSPAEKLEEGPKLDSHDGVKPATTPPKE